ncbi:MAG TPA: hypothetical protein VHC19_21975, partial [Pirellulales bacterium]|nr:hypothetical protein [Pirellulales bacterium]
MRFASLFDRKNSKSNRSLLTALTGPRSQRSLSSERSRSRFVEPLEDRRLLSVTTAYVANAADFTDAANPGNPQPGDTVTWNGGGQFASPVTGLTFGTDAFTSIAAAVANVSSGGTVDVAPGTYNEHSISLNQPITLNGPNFGVDPNASTRSAEAIIDGQTTPNVSVLDITSNDVIVSGFTVQGAAASGISMGASTSGVQVLDNVITNNSIGIYANSNGSSLIQDNLLTANNVAGPAGGTAIYSDAGINGLTINHNVINDQTINSAITLAATTADQNKNVTVSNNVIDIASSGNSAIYAIAVDGGVFNDNEITTNGGGSAIHLAGDDTNISILNNNLNDNVYGVSVTDDGYAFGANASVTINYNSIVGSTTAGVNIGNSGSPYTGALDATRNWWGDISGPTIASNSGGAGQAIVDPGSQVTYRPWLIYGTDADATAAGFQLPTIIPVTAGGDNSAADNDFTRLQNAVGAVAAGQTLDLSGTFDWTSPFAAAAYAASNADSATSDLRGVLLPSGVNNVTITSSGSNATIKSGGDFGDNIYSSFLFAADGPSAQGNDNLTIENLNLEHFESGIMLGWNATGQFNDTLVQNNTITVAGDNGYVQNIAVYFWHGTNQHMLGNTINFEADGTNTDPVWGPASSFGFQDGTTGGTGYDGLEIENNTFQLVGSSFTSETVTAIWENGHNDDNSSHITISGNQILGIQGVKDIDHGLELSSQTSNMQIDGNTFTDVNDVFYADHSVGASVGDQFTFTNNILTRVGGADGVFLQNVTDDPTPVHIQINWNINNTIDGETGVRGLNELSTQATHASRPTSAASDIDAVVAVGAR